MCIVMQVVGAVKQRWSKPFGICAMLMEASKKVRMNIIVSIVEGNCENHKMGILDSEGRKLE